jgi:hypothetical protein
VSRSVTQRKCGIAGVQASWSGKLHKDYGNNHSRKKSMTSSTHSRRERQSQPRCPQIVTQAELDHLHSLRRAIQDANQLRERILRRLNAGAAVEEGPLTAIVQMKCQIRFSREKLTAVLGLEAVEHIEELIEPTEMEFLEIQRAPSTHSEPGRTELTRRNCAANPGTRPQLLQGQ